ncbi:hypothetical protein HanHA300_Chr00c1041g0834481 [Helianthus annuus]|nr:hypothetical protein HanHA300_Chr00c1041g0834481 [Helianthus annuus]
MTIEEIKEHEEEGPPPQVESEITNKPRRIALFVEPSPFASSCKRKSTAYVDVAWC